MSNQEDVLYDAAVAFVRKKGRVRLPEVLIHFRIGLNRAIRLIEAMAMNGVVSPTEINGHRDVLGGEQ